MLIAIDDEVLERLPEAARLVDSRNTSVVGQVFALLPERAVI
jgi:hypothetical protein